MILSNIFFLFIGIWESVTSRGNLDWKENSVLNTVPTPQGPKSVLLDHCPVDLYFHISKMYHVCNVFNFTSLFWKLSFNFISPIWGCWKNIRLYSRLLNLFAIIEIKPSFSQQVNYSSLQFKCFQFFSPLTHDAIFSWPAEFVSFSCLICFVNVIC